VSKAPPDSGAGRDGDIAAEDDGRDQAPPELGVRVDLALHQFDQHRRPLGVPEEADKRRVILRLSARGRAAATVIADAGAAAEREASDRIGSATMVELRAALEGFVDR
jgi:hypothetical protein